VLGNSMMSGDVIMKISALTAMEVNVEVNESDIVRVNLGDTALVEVDAYKDEKFRGLVTEIGNTALNSLTSAALSMDQVTNFSVKIRILPESYQHLAAGKDENYSPFKPGMSATVDVITERANKVLSVPIKSVAAREDTSSMSLAQRILNKDKVEEAREASGIQEPFTVIFILNESTNQAEVRVVETGIQDDKFIQVKSGINDGEQIITGPYEQVSRKLKTGDKVKIKSEENEGEEKSDSED